MYDALSDSIFSAVGVAVTQGGLFGVQLTKFSSELDFLADVQLGEPGILPSAGVKHITEVIDDSLFMIVGNFHDPDFTSRKVHPYSGLMSFDPYDLTTIKDSIRWPHNNRSYQMEMQSARMKTRTTGEYTGTFVYVAFTMRLFSWLPPGTVNHPFGTVGSLCNNSVV